MKKVFMLLSLSITATAVMPSVGSAKLVLDLPPILAGKTAASCNNCNPCDTTSCTNPCNSCTTCCGSICMDSNASCTNCCGEVCQTTTCGGGCNNCNPCDTTSCTNPCTTCASCCGTTCMDNNASCITCCDNNICKATATCPAGCTEDADCGSNQYCCDGSCQTTACPVACTSAGNCSAAAPNCCNGFCQAATCIPAAAGMNDTGITSPAGTSKQEDADFGRDANNTTNSDTDGWKGFSFTKLSATGGELAATAPSWSCVRDNVTKLIWEHKSAPAKLPWYNSDGKTNGGNAGSLNTNTNTQQYAANANAASLCGYNSGWRVPTIKELVGLLNSSKTAMAADQTYFQGINSNNHFFWSSTPSAANSAQAWGVNFNLGMTDMTFMKSNLNNQSIMLVRTAD